MQVANALEAAPGGAELGSLTLTGKGKELKRDVVLQPYSSDGAPTEFELESLGVDAEVGGAASRTSGKMYGISVSTGRDSVRLEGLVSQQFTLKPKQGEGYEEYIRKRNLEAREAKVRCQNGYRHKLSILIL